MPNKAKVAKESCAVHVATLPEVPLPNAWGGAGQLAYPDAGLGVTPTQP